MCKKFNRRVLLSSAAMVLALMLAHPAKVRAEEPTYQFDIPAEPLNQALADFSRMASRQIIFSDKVVAGYATVGLHGRYTVEQALDALLKGAELTVEVNPSGVLMVKAKKRDSARADDGGAANIETVIVSATKRPEAARRISGSVAALTGDDLDARGASSMADYLALTPGVVFNPSMPGSSSVTIRGISTTTLNDQGQGATGYFINDVPLTDPFSSVAIPDIDAFDVDNVVVLRGPQGTLFGSASLGGAVNYSAAKPKLDSAQYRVQGSVLGTQGGEAGGAAKGMINMPVIMDSLAFRGVYVYREDPGFIDNVGLGVKNSNRTLTRGGRFQAVFVPSARTQVNYLFLDQSENTSDIGYQQPGPVGILKKTSWVAEPFNSSVLIHNLRLDQDTDWGTLTATATYHQKSQQTQLDDTVPFAGTPLRKVVSPQSGYSRGYTFETRLASPAGRQLDYVIGAMHDRTKEYFSQTIEAPGGTAFVEAYLSPLLGKGIGSKLAPDNVLNAYAFPTKAQETALFGEATYHLTDNWKATLGGRAFQTDVSESGIEYGLVNFITAGAFGSSLGGRQKESGVTPKASLTWTRDDDLMAYALVSKGFRFGGANHTPSEPNFTVPLTYGSDSLWNYELGTRANLFDRKLALDATVFYIDWTNIQLRLFTPHSLSYGTNASAARSFGFEGVSTWRITPDLSLSGNLTYLDASLAAPFVQGPGQPTAPKGTVLPGASKWQTAETLTYHWTEGPFSPVFSLSHRYRSSAPGLMFSNVVLGNYSTLDARISAYTGPVEVALFANNIGNVRGITNGVSTFGGVSGLAQFVTRPRTIGLTLDYKFK